MAIPGLSAGEDLAIEFDNQGPSSIRIGNTEVLFSGKPSLVDVTLSSEYRNRNDEPASQAFRPDQRIIREGSLTPVSEHFDQRAKLLVQTYEWGIINIEYWVEDDRIDFEILVINRGNEVIDAVEIELLTLEVTGNHYAGAVRAGTGLMYSNSNFDGPMVNEIRFSSGAIVFAELEGNRPFRAYMKGQSGRYELRLAAGSRGGNHEPLHGVWNARPIKPGESDAYFATLRFNPDRSFPLNQLAGDIYRDYAEAVPMLLNWPDRRPLASIHVADGRRGGKNPRGWKVAIALPENWDVKQDRNYAVFHKAVMDAVPRIVEVTRRSGAQGVIVWQIEGMQEPGHAYYGEPRIMRFTAPEMDGIADDFFRALREAGLRVGVTLRPVIQIPFDPKEGKHSGPISGVKSWNDLKAAAIRADWSVEFRNVDWLPSIPPELRDVYDEEEAWSVFVRLDNKITYAKERWGATLFYLDANFFHGLAPDGYSGQRIVQRPLSATVLEALIKKHPDCLIIPEHQSFRYWASGAQYIQPPHYDQTATPSLVRLTYPEAMTVIAAVELDEFFLKDEEHYVQAVVNGDVFLTHGWFAGHHKLLDAIYGKAAQEAPFKVHISARDIQINGQSYRDLDRLKSALRTAFPKTSAIPPRRVYVTYSRELNYSQQVQPVLDAIMASGGILAWTQPQ